MGQDAHSVLWAKYYSGRFAPCHWAFCPLCSVLHVLVLSYLSCINKVIQRILLHLTLKVISEGLGLAVTVCVAPSMGQDAHSNGKIIIELFLPYIASFCGSIVI